MARSRPLLVLTVSLAIVAAACGSSDETTTSAADTVASPTTAATSTTSAAEATTTSEVESTTTIPETTTSSTLAGQVIDFFPQPGDVLSVVGVAHNDALNVRAAPGVFNDIVDIIEPDGTSVALGIARDLGLAIWVEHDSGSFLGWSNYTFLAFAGVTDDATSEVVGLLGEFPTADSMEALGRVVAESLASTEPPSFIVMTVAATVDDLGEVTYDVIGLGDDAVYGYRLHVFGEPVTDGFSLRDVERTYLCSRGVDEDRLCV